MIFFRFSKKLGFWVFFVHPTVVSVLLSASVERCFVSRMRSFMDVFDVLDFLWIYFGGGFDFLLLLYIYICKGGFWILFKVTKVTTKN